jgi:Mn-containing catalase
MFYQDGKLQYPVRVDNPSPIFARALQQAIGGVEGEIRVMMQYMFQAWGSRGAQKYRDMLLNTGTEEIAHIEMLATVAMNLEGSPMTVKEEAAEANPMVAAIMGGMNMRHFLSTGMAATPENCNGVPFNASHVYASGNLAADMMANVAAESTGRVLACRLYEMTDDAGMRDMLSFLIARDAMHQQQWLAVIEELGGYEKVLPIPNSFPQSQEAQEFSYAYFATGVEGTRVPEGRFTSGPSLDRNGEFSLVQITPMGQEPQLAPPIPQGYAQNEDLEAGRARAAMHKEQMNRTQPGAGNKPGGDGGIIENIKDTILGE